MEIKWLLLYIAIQYLTYKMRLTYCLLFISLTATLASCGRTRKKGLHAVARRVDKVFPIFNSANPDTEFNKKRFKEYLGVDLTADVHDIYTYADFLGVDYTVLISFHCDTSTVNRIVQRLELAPADDSHVMDLEFMERFHWWDQKAIHTIVPFMRGKEQEYYNYLWYDKKTKTAYYEDFSL
jgi:hypothetical protein